MQKEPFIDKLIKRFYGITGPLDEYKRREVDRIGNVAFIVLSYTLLLGNFIALILAYRYPQRMASAYPIFLELMLLLLFAYVIFKGKKAGVSEFTEEELSAKEQKQLKHAGLKIGVYFAVGMYLLQGLVNFVSDGIAVMETWTSPKTFVMAIIQGIFFGGFMHLVVKSRRKKGEK